MSMAVTAPASSHAHLLPQNYKRQIAFWLEEDCPSLDVGGFVVGDAPGEARLLCKSPGVVAGVPFFDEVFAQLDCTVDWHVSEGDSITAQDATAKRHCATVQGPMRKILLGERVALNLLARCSGIASRTNRILTLLRSPPLSYRGALAGTRKTTPGFRLVEKYGILVGGADPHRHDLSSMTMLKDNHIWACAARVSATAEGSAQSATNGDSSLSSAAPLNGETAAVKPPSASPAQTAAAIHTAVSTARSAAGFSTKIEVECQTEAEADAAIKAGADVVMLDNFTPKQMKETARRLKDRWGRDGRFLIEVSGGLRESNLETYVCQDVDVLSSSSLHQGVATVDFSLKVVH